MIPKIQTATTAVGDGVEAIVIVDGRRPHAVASFPSEHELFSVRTARRPRCNAAAGRRVPFAYAVGRGPVRSSHAQDEQRTPSPGTRLTRAAGTPRVRGLESSALIDHRCSPPRELVGGGIVDSDTRTGATPL